MNSLNMFAPVKFYAVFWVMLLTLSRFAFADETALKGVIWHNGKIEQGGLIIAQLPQDSQAYLDEMPLPQSKEGIIAFGFHRDDIKTQILRVTDKDNHQHLTELTPQTRSYKTQSITGLASKYVSPPQKVLDRIAKDRDDVTTARSRTSTQDGFAKTGFNWPVQGIITGVYGSQRILNGQPRAPHYGIDIAASTGTAIHAPAAGIITLVEDLYYTGWTIIIDHGLGISSTYLHLSSADVAVGDKVEIGALIGKVGSTGRSTGAHLDWRLNWYQKRLDPQLAANSPHP